MKSKKRSYKVLIFIVIFFLLSSFSLACTKKFDNIELDIAEVANEMLGQIEFEDDMVSIDKEAIMILYDIIPDSFTECIVYVSENASAGELAIFRASNKSNIADVKKAIEHRLTEQKMSYEEYLVEELPKLDSAYITQEGLYTILCVSNDNTKTKSIIRGAIRGNVVN